MTMRIVLMGVAGCGKSTVGVALGAALAIAYRDGDDFHGPANVAKMARAEPLTDADRWPWLTEVAYALRDHAPLILGCSALKRAYRDHIRNQAGAPVTFVHLSGSRAVIEARMTSRTGHFMPVALLNSQFDTLEPPSPDEAAISIDIDQPLDGIVADILAGLGGALNSVSQPD